METTPHRRGVLVRHAQRAVAPDEEDGAEHARPFRDADPGGLGHDGAHQEVDFAVEHLVSAAAADAGLGVFEDVVGRFGLGGLWDSSSCWRRKSRRRGRGRTGSGSAVIWIRGGDSSLLLLLQMQLLLLLLLLLPRTSDDPSAVEPHK
jgi:hypothetical protein